MDVWQVADFNLQWLVYLVAAPIFVVSLWLMVRLIAWAKRRPAKAFFLLAILPFLSLFPIPPTEIKKLQQVKQQQIKPKDQSGKNKEDGL